MTPINSLDFPALVAAAPKGLFMTGTPDLELDGDTGTGFQTLCFVDQTNHHMRIGWYTDTYRRTEGGWRLADQVNDLPPTQWRTRRWQTARPQPSRAIGFGGLNARNRRAVELSRFKAEVDAWLDANEEELTSDRSTASARWTSRWINCAR